MSKYSSSLKVEIVQLYLEDHISLTIFEQKYNIPKRYIRKWVTLTKVQGLEALRVKHSRRIFSLDFKLNVVRYYKTHDVGYGITAANFNINPSQVHTWNKLFNLYGSQAFVSRPKGRPTPMKKSDKRKETITLTEKQKYEERILQLEAKLHDAELDRDFLKKLHALRSGKQIGKKP
ncbi:hypothetical protein LABALGNA3A7_06360 [Dellaglioa algida]|nr:hypothetical protein LABALGNA3A7_06360 [Dellaglioa algida]